MIESRLASSWRNVFSIADSAWLTSSRTVTRSSSVKTAPPSRPYEREHAEHLAPAVDRHRHGRRRRRLGRVQLLRVLRPLGQVVMGDPAGQPGAACSVSPRWRSAPDTSRATSALPFSLPEHALVGPGDAHHGLEGGIEDRPAVVGRRQHRSQAGRPTRGTAAGWPRGRRRGQPAGRTARSASRSPGRCHGRRSSRGAAPARARLSTRPGPDRRWPGAGRLTSLRSTARNTAVGHQGVGRAATRPRPRRGR